MNNITLISNNINLNKEDILAECIKTIDQSMVNKAYIVLFIIFITPIIKYFGLKALINSQKTYNSWKYEFIKDLLLNLWIIDYCVMAAYLFWIILLSKAW